MTNHEIVGDYLDWLENKRRRSATTIRTYRAVLNSYLAWLGDRPLADIRHDDVEDFASRRTFTASAAVQRKDVVIVRTFHAWAADRDYDVHTVRTAVAPSVMQAEPKPVDDEHWRKLWVSDLTPSDRMWLGLGYFAGLRRIEIVTIRPTEIRPEAGVAVFTRKGSIRFPVEYIECLRVIEDELPQLAEGRGREWLDILHATAAQRQEIGADRLWWEGTGEPEYDGNRLNKRLANLTAALGIPPGAVTPHRLRHSCATNLFRAGLPLEYVQAQLGHSSVELTRRYARMTGEMARWRARERARHAATDGSYQSLV